MVDIDFGRRDSMLSDKLAGVSKKKITIAILAALAILLPSFLAIFNIIYTNSDASSASRSSVSVTLYDVDGNQLHYEDSTTEYEGDASLTAIFKAICGGMEKTEPISDVSLNQAPIRADLQGFGSYERLTCYFSFTSGASFCIDSNGQYYKIKNEDSERFLRSAFSETVFTDAVPPTLSTADGDSVIPSSVDWFYRGFDGSFKRAQRITVTDKRSSYYVTGSISLSFSLMPDFCVVRIFQGEELIFEGALEELPYITLDSSVPVRITVRAVWNEIDGRKYHGEINYDFNLGVRHRAYFSLSRDTLGVGEFAIISASNVSDISRLSFTAEDGEPVPQFYIKGDGAYAIIPYLSDLEQYTFTVTYGVASKTFTVSMDDSVDPSRDADVTSELLGIEMGNGTNIMNDHIFLGNVFCDPEAYGYDARLGFGDTFTVDEKEYFSVFNEYVLTESHGMTVKACYGGRVIHSGNNSIMGNYVIIDVGLGMRLWYCGLSDVDVRIGGYVAAGDTVGKTGKLTASSGEGFMLILSCGESLLDPDTVLGKNLDLV